MVVFKDVSVAKMGWEEESGATGTHVQKMATISSQLITSFSLQKADLKIFLFMVKMKKSQITWGGWGCVRQRNEQDKTVFLNLKLFQVLILPLRSRYRHLMVNACDPLVSFMGEIRASGVVLVLGEILNLCCLVL